MKIKMITCSGPNEHTNPEKLLDLLAEFFDSEAGIQVSGDKAELGMPRYEWIKELSGLVRKQFRNINLALHVNKDWVEKLGQGIVVPELAEFLELEDGQGNKLFRRVQLNFKVGREKTPDIDALCAVIGNFPKQRFILSYNSDNAELINEMYRRGVMFDVLFDGSFGKGIVPHMREKAVFKDRLQGYAGGLGADNIERELDKISAVAGANDEIYVDAQKKLEDGDEKFDIAKALDFICKIKEWQFKHV